MGALLTRPDTLANDFVPQLTGYAIHPGSPPPIMELVIRLDWLPSQLALPDKAPLTQNSTLKLSMVSAPILTG